MSMQTKFLESTTKLCEKLDAYQGPVSLRTNNLLSACLFRLGFATDRLDDDIKKYNNSVELCNLVDELKNTIVGNMPMSLDDIRNLISDDFIKDLSTFLPRAHSIEALKKRLIPKTYPDDLKLPIYANGYEHKRRSAFEFSIYVLGRVAYGHAYLRKFYFNQYKKNL